jgi:hypothetical protein
MSPTLGELLHAPPDGRFDPAELDGLPEPVQRHLRHAIARGTPVFRSVRLSMRGRIKLGRWLPFRADEFLAPHRGFVWKARIAGVIGGSDRYIAGAGGMTWKLAGLVPLVQASDADIGRSAAGRAGGEAIWVPTAMLPRFGVTWAAGSDERISARFNLDQVPIEMHLDIDPDGAIRSFWFDRWGDPERSGSWGWHRCGGEVTASRTFHGLTIPSAGRFGWHVGTDHRPAGEFFRFELTSLDPVGSTV